jgi:hypothetical protein
MAFVGWDQGFDGVFHSQLPQYGADQGQMVQTFDIHHLRDWCRRGPHPLLLLTFLPSMKAFQAGQKDRPGPAPLLIKTDRPLHMTLGRSHPQPSQIASPDATPTKSSSCRRSGAVAVTWSSPRNSAFVISCPPHGTTALEFPPDAPYDPVAQQPLEWLGLP